MKKYFLISDEDLDTCPARIINKVKADQPSISIEGHNCLVAMYNRTLELREQFIKDPTPENMANFVKEVSDIAVSISKLKEKEDKELADELPF